MNTPRTRCMFFYFAKIIRFVSCGNICPFCLHLFLRTSQQPSPACCNRSTTNFKFNCLYYPCSCVDLMLLCVVKIECATRLSLTPIAKRSNVCLGQRCRMVRLFMRASLQKKSTVCKRDVLSVCMLSTTRLPFWTSYSTKTLSYTLCYVSLNARSQRH